MKWGKKKKPTYESKLIQKTQNTIRAILKIERGELCEICQKPGRVLGVFHILPVSTHKRLRFCFENVLLSCWFPCHYLWHHDFEKAKGVNDRIIQLRGKDYKFDLMAIERTLPRMTVVYIEQVFIEMKNRLDELTNKPKGKKHVKVRAEERYVPEAR